MRGADHQAVAFHQAFEGQRQPAQLVFEIGIGARQVDNQLRVEHGQRGAVAVAQAVQVLAVAHAIGQVNVQAGGRLLGGVVVELVDGEREHRRVAGENRGRAVAVVHVAIHHHGALDGAIALHAADGHGDVVDGAEAFSMVRKRVVESAAQVESHAGPESAWRAASVVPPAASQKASTNSRL